ncbi:unnamed protein product [Didymodactylos carnosus]|uniref:Poly [ADP-ribose] polymerase n=1 Tax=Didymodactylos carnosus TaxID=1234261 RepID=A0A8S2GE20_9BILA|nr:unnamed protein product [Didymodactylos carnosus]CAF3502301.1 unnamed protein product [Didymodactylos carnosus]
MPCRFQSIPTSSYHMAPKKQTKALATKASATTRGTKAAISKAKKPASTRAAGKKRAAPPATKAKSTKKRKLEEEPEEENEEDEVSNTKDSFVRFFIRKRVTFSQEEEAVNDEEISGKSEIIKKLRAADQDKKKKYTPDKHIIGGASNYQVYEDYDAMLNQTNIGHNNNKFYVIQVLKQGPSYYVWNRWGRVGEVGSNNGLSGPYNSPEPAIKEFEHKFKDKTKNNWKQRADFQAVAKKYTLIETAGEEGEEEEEKSVVSTKTVTATDGTVYAPSKLDTATQALMKLIFDTDMFKDALKKFDIDSKNSSGEVARGPVQTDVKKMPLGKLSKTQIAKGFEILEELEKVIESKTKGNLDDISSKFYTAIPHDFGRTRPKPINTREALQQKYDMLAVLADIELAQTLQTEKSETDTTDAKPHPYDVNYGALRCSLELVDKKSNEFKIIDEYTNNTQGYRKCKIENVWRVGREFEGANFATHEAITNRKLLWHGTNVAVVVAILKSGLRIMPHSGGRVGKGIYFASENGKSAGYVGTTTDGGTQTGIMFLNEVALGKEHHITSDNPSLKKPPPGYDCVIAKGQTEPDPTKDIPLTIEKKTVIVPCGKTVPTTHTSSSFSQSE